MKKNLSWLVIPSMIALFALATGCSSKNDDRKDHHKKEQNTQKRRGGCGCRR